MRFCRTIIGAVSESLYDMLACRSPNATASGETATTRQKETLDADTEERAFDDDDRLGPFHMYCLLSDALRTAGATSETALTKKTETTDEVPPDHHDDLHF